MKKVALTAALLTLPFASQAKFLFEVNAGVGSWLVPEATGSVQGALSDPSDLFEINSDSALSLKKDDNGVYFWADIDHPVPFLQKQSFVISS